MGDLLTISQACALVNVSASTMERRISEGKIRVLRSEGSRARFLDASEVKDLFEPKYTINHGGTH